MPKENRSSNTEMVSVPREAVVQAAELLQEYNKCSIARDLRAILAQPAEQHQGEPVAWRGINDLGEVVTEWIDGIPPESMVDLCGNPASFAKIERAYTHADPGEVERLRLERRRMDQALSACANERDTLRVELDSMAETFGMQEDKIDALRAQLLKRDALLREKSGDLIRMAAHLISAPLIALQDLQDEDKKMTRARVDKAVDTADARLKDAAYELRRIADALAASAEPKCGKCHGRSLLRIATVCGPADKNCPDCASAEPSAPAMQIPEGYCVMPRRLTAENGAKALLLGEFKLEVTRECPECLELEEPTEGCEICDGAGEYGQRYTIPWDKIKFIYSEAVKGLALKQ